MRYCPICKKLSYQLSITTNRFACSNPLCKHNETDSEVKVYSKYSAVCDRLGANWGILSNTNSIFELPVLIELMNIVLNSDKLVEKFGIDTISKCLVTIDNNSKITLIDRDSGNELKI